MNPNGLGINNQNHINNNGNNNLLARLASLQQQITMHKRVHPQLLYGCTTCGIIYDMMGTGMNTQSIISPPNTNMLNMHNMNNIMPNTGGLLLPQSYNNSSVSIYPRNTTISNL